MGLIAMAKHIKKVEEFKKLFFETFGMSVEEAKAKLAKCDEVKPVQIDADTKQKIAEANRNKMSPAELVESFADEVEEFYPNGKPDKH